MCSKVKVLVPSWNGIRKCILKSIGIKQINSSIINFLFIYQASEDDDHEKEEGFGSRISSAAFLMIMEDGIRTFMEFLKADKEKPCQKLSSMFRRKRRGSVDPTLLDLMKKVNQKVSYVVIINYQVQ